MSRFKRSIFRKSLLMPAEHGSWAWLLVPLAVGTAAAGRFHLAVTFTLVGGLSLFLLRQPLTVWLRARRGRARRGDGPIAAGWTLAFSLAALVSLLGLLALGRAALLWLLPPLALLLGLYLAAALSRGTTVRTLWMELAGAAGLAAMAPAGYIAATGRLDAIAWGLWGLMAGQNVLGALYVRQRIANTHGRLTRPALTFGGHALGLVAVLAAAFGGLVPWLTAVPFLGFLLRAGWASLRPRPIAHIKRFGFTEMGIEILGGAWIAAVYWLSLSI